MRRDHQLVERAGQRRARQLASGGQQLLGDERQPARPLGDEQQQAGRCPFALDPLDQGRQLVPIERRDDKPRSAGAGRPSIAARSAVHGSSRATTSDWCVPTIARRCSAGDPGQERDQGAGGGVGEVEVLDDEHDRLPLAEPAEQRRGCPRASAPGVAPGRSFRRCPARSPRASSRGPRSGSRRTTSEVAGPSTPASHRPAGRARSGRSPGRSGRTARRRGPATRRPAGRSAARAGPRSGRSPRRGSGSRRPRPSRRAGPCASGHGPRRRARRQGCAKASSRPTNRALVYVAGMTAFYGPASARLDRHDRRPAPAASRQHAQRAARRGMAVLHQVADDHGLPIRARPRRAQGPRREQAAAADGPPDRVLQPDRRARARPVRRGRRHAARGGHRARPAPGARHRARAAVGDRVRVGRPRPRVRARRARPRARRPRRGRPGRAARLRSSGCRAARRRRAGDPADACRIDRSTSSRPTRRTTCSCR